MKNKFKYLLTILLVTNTMMFSQFDTEAIRLNYTFIPYSNLSNADAKAVLHEIDFQSYTPTIKIGNTTKLNSIISYRLYDYNFQVYEPNLNVYPDNLHHFKYTLLIRQKINENWNLYAAPRLNIRTDFKRSIHSDDLFPALTAIFVKDVIKNPNYKYGIGLNFNNNNGKFRVLPAVYFQYKRDNMKISAFVPSRASIMWTKNKKYAYGFGYYSESNITHLNLPQNPLENPNDITYLRNMNVFIHPTYSKNLGSNIWATIKTGISVSRLYEQYDSNYDDVSEFYNDEFKPNFFFNFGISYKVDSENK